MNGTTCFRANDIRIIKKEMEGLWARESGTLNSRILNFIWGKYKLIKPLNGTNSLYEILLETHLKINLDILTNDKQSDNSKSR